MPLGAILPRPSWRHDPSRRTTMPRSTVMPLPTPAYDRQQGARFKVVGEASAGHPFRAVPPPDSAVRIFTGAVMPSGLDTVVMQEDVRIEEQKWAAGLQLFPPGLKQGANRRLAGEDSKPGAVLVEAGTRSRPQDVATAAACGLDRLRCYAPPQGRHRLDRRRDPAPGRLFAPGKVYDANAPMLEGLIEPRAQSR